MTELELKIKNAAESYYKDGTSELSDEEFDKLVEQLRLENPNSEVLTTGWGYTPYSDENSKHLYHRIEGIHDKRKNFDWLDDHKMYHVSAKFDGISCVAYYENGKFVKALTRGDGFNGSVIEGYNFPDANDPSFTGYIRGEMLISNENYKKYDNGKSARNYSAGCIAKKDASTLDFIPYTLYDKRLNFTTFVNGMVPNEARFVIVTGWELKKKGIKIVEKYNLNADHIFDGIVVQPSEDETRMIAIKVSEAKNSTKVTSIEWQTGRTGKITPVIHFEPINLAGAKIGKASFGSYRLLMEKKLGIGSEVVVTRVGDVIPQVTEILTEGTPTPPKCSACGSEDVKIVGAHAFCNNPDCLLKSTSIMLARLIQCRIEGKGFQFGSLLKILEDNRVTLEMFTDSIKNESSSDFITLLLGFCKPKQRMLIEVAWMKLLAKKLTPAEVAYSLGIESPRSSYITKDALITGVSKSMTLNENINEKRKLIDGLNEVIGIEG